MSARSAVPGDATVERLSKPSVPVAKELAPSDGLRRWYGHEPERFDEFRRRYVAELEGQEGALERLRDRYRAGTVTLVFAARDAEHSNAAVLAELLATR